MFTTGPLDPIFQESATHMDPMTRTASPSAPAAVQKIGPSVLGMILFIASEIMFFGTLFAAYLSVRAAQSTWPPAGTPIPSPGLPLILTAILLASSVTQHRAAKSAGPDGARRWTGLTIVLAVAFLAGQGWEWSRLAGEGLAMDSGPFGMVFYLLTGAHGLHVIGGLMMLIAMWFRLAAGSLDRSRSQGLEAVTYYWHFVDAIWLAVLVVVYLMT